MDDLVRRLQAKEEMALHIVMEQYSQYLLQTAFLLVKDLQVAEESVQDTFVIAYEKAYQLDDAAKLKSWLTTIVLNQCRARMRRWSWGNIFVRHKDEEWELVAEEEAGPEEILLSRDLNQSVVQVIQELEYKYREAIILYYFNELTIAEIAKQLKENENTIKTRLARGRKLLKEKLEREGYAHDRTAK